MARLSQAAPNAVDKIAADLAERVRLADDANTITQRRADDLERRLAQSGSRAAAAERRVTELRKLLLIAEVKIGHLEGRLQTVSEVHAREDTPVTTSVQVAKAPLNEFRQRELDHYYAGTRGVSETGRHWLDD